MNVRAFGAFEGTIAHPGGEAILQPLLLEAVRAATAQYSGALLSLDKQKAAIAQAAESQLAPRLHVLGAVGTLSITAFSFAPEDHEKLVEVGRQAALAAIAARTDACLNCGAIVPGKFCRECGAPRASAASPPAAAAIAGPARTITRPPGGGTLAYVVRGPFPGGSTVVVDEGFTFFGVSQGRAMELPAGAHPALATCELGVFARTVGVKILARGAVGELPDATGTLREVHAVISGTVKVEDPVAIAQSLGDRDKLEDAPLRTTIQSVVLIAARAVMQERFGSGAWPVGMLEDDEGWNKPVAHLPEVAPAIGAAYLASNQSVRGLTLTVNAATLLFAKTEPGAAPPQSPAPVAAAAGVGAGAPVLVRWSDGQSYPGIARESRDGQVLVAFPNGGMQWIPAQFVSPA